MANRNQSDVPEHETLPGPGPGHKSTRGAPPSVRPVEQMVDAAIERLANEHLARQRGSFEPQHDSEHELDLALYETPPSRPRKPTRLRWKGLEVSDEFRSYAERVARGEDLPPFEGRVLAEPNPAFPWDQAAPVDPPRREGRASRIVLWSSAAVVLALLGWSIVDRLEGPALATLGDVPAVSASSSASASALATPSDVVEQDVVERDAVERDVVTSATLDREPQASLDVTEPAVATPATAAMPTASEAKSASSAPSAVAPAAGGQASASAPVVSTTPAAAATPKIAAPGALEHAIGAVFAARAAETGSSKPEVAGTNASQDDFGILPPGNAVPAVPITTTPTATAAKSDPPLVGSVGDLARARQPSPGAVRKEPGTESSAKGSLLVEVPSF
jgi:hypothetical protein